MRLVIFIFIFIPYISFSQKITLKISSSDNIVTYATVTDSVKGIVGYSNNIGLIILNQDNYSLSISHVSYKRKNIYITKPQRDTFINVELEPKNSTLEAVVINPQKINKKKFFQFGNFYHKTGNRFTDRLQSLIGIKFQPPNFQNDLILRSIKFKIDKVVNLSDKDFVLELKIYELNVRGTVSEDPLNKKPVYISSKDLKKKNEIFFTEIIKIPQNGIFISLEFPKMFDDNYDITISFFADFDNENPLVYLEHNTTKWDDEILLHGSHRPPYSKYMRLNFGITYWKLLNQQDKKYEN